MPDVYSDFSFWIIIFCGGLAANTFLAALFCREDPDDERKDPFRKKSKTKANSKKNAVSKYRNKGAFIKMCKFCRYNNERSCEKQSKVKTRLDKSPIIK